MAVNIPGTLPRDVGDGQTGSQRAGGFVTVQTSGVRDLARSLLRAATAMGRDATKPLTDAAKQAAAPVMAAYKSNISDVTGNLKRSVRVQAGKKKYEGVGIAVAGPIHVVNTDEWDVLKKGAGNHAWLFEFGTGRRKPGSQNRRTYVNVHQSINGKMNRVANERGGLAFDNEKFEKMGRGYYFLMGSKNVAQRKSGKGAFVPDGRGGTRPYYLASGDTYGAMKPSHAMEKAIQQASPAALNALKAAINVQINKLTR